MFGISYGELFLLIGATAALIGPKDLPVIGRAAGRLAGRAVAYVQVARGQFDSVMQQSQARQVHKELQDTIAQLEAIRHEIRSISVLHPGPMTRSLADNIRQNPPGYEKSAGAEVKQNTPMHDQVNRVSEGLKVERKSPTPAIVTSKSSQSCSSTVSDPCNLQSQATAYAKIAESSTLKSGSVRGHMDMEKLGDDAGLLSVLPVSAESAGLLPKRKDDVKGSDIVLEAILEAEVAHNAREFFAQPQNQLKFE